MLYDLCLHSTLDDIRIYLTGGVLLPRLKNLSVESVHPESSLTIQQFFVDVTRHYPALEVLSVDVIVGIQKQHRCEPLLPEHVHPLLSLKQLARLELRHNLPLQISEVDLAELGAALPTIEALVLNPEPLQLARPQLTLGSLLSIAENFPNLSHLGIYLDAEDVTTPTPHSPGKQRTFPCLRTLNMGASPIRSDHISVALFLSHLLSENGVVIQSGVSWSQVLFDDEYSATVGQRCRGWDEVARVLPLLRQMHKVEKAHRQDMEKEVEDLRMRNERLNQQVKSMSDRIRQLEAALADAENGSLPPAALGDEPSSVSQDSFQDREPTSVEYEGDLDSVSKNLGSLAIDEEGKAQYYGETAGAEFLQHLMPVVCPVAQSHSTYLLTFDPVPRGDFEQTVLEPLYSSVNDIVPLLNFEPHRLSVFFMVIATGALFDSQPTARIIAEQYHAFACATFCLESIVNGATCASIQGLLMMAHFLFLTDRSGNERRWLLKGLCTKVIHMLGLQRDSAGWNLNEEEVQRRRTLFWEFFTWECWACVIHGRPPTLNLAHSDCRFPRDLQPHLLPSGKSELSFHSWKFHYSAVCLSVSVQRAFSVKRESYSSLLELDRRIRSFPLPTHLLSPVYGTRNRDWDSDPSRAMQQFFAACERESNVGSRKRYVVHLDPLQHEYGQSVVAVYRSANILINGLRRLAGTHPKLAGRVWFFWSSLYTSSVLLGAIVVKSPGCKLAHSALSLLDQSLTVYEEGSRLSRPPATMPMLEKLRHRAHHAYSAFASNMSGGSQTPLPFTLPDNIHDLSAFGGTRGGVISKSPTNSPEGSGAPSPPDSSLSALSADVSANSIHQPARSSQSPIPLATQSAFRLLERQVFSTPLRPTPSGDDGAGLVPVHPDRGDASPNQRAPIFGPSIFVSPERSLPSSLKGGDPGYSPSETAPFSPSQEPARERNQLVSLPTGEEILDVDLEALVLPLAPQRPMEYSQYPQLQQFQDILMSDGADGRPPQIPQDDVWWQFVDDLGIQRI
ncbi:fungal-specific transcription factor domain-containing protein [Russula earlei]|uniref:Fungal-specific transcription factor domain-containing protein n=1 Tax=Russula earlei TaxID=71964 RepID=A0ACC0UIR4_9AGAM|nr:fungal-specific transcription factor domain-containing protein [Russula earlei]